MEPDDDKTRIHMILSKGTQVGHYLIVQKTVARGITEFVAIL